jgi:hypothetical protein
MSKLHWEKKLGHQNEGKVGDLTFHMEFEFVTFIGFSNRQLKPFKFVQCRDNILPQSHKNVLQFVRVNVLVTVLLLFYFYFFIMSAL